MPLLSGGRYFRGAVSFGTLRYLNCVISPIVFPQQIVIPDKSSKTEDGLARFQFSCSKVEKNMRQDCIQQMRSSEYVTSLGTVAHKVNVMATDDSYQMTQQRMKEAEEVRKGIRCVIHLSDLYLEGIFNGKVSKTSKGPFII